MTHETTSLYEDIHALLAEAPGAEQDAFLARLDAVVDLELHQDVRDVVLDRLRADVEVGGDLRVVLAVRDQLEDLDLAVGELGADRPLDLRLAARRADAAQHLRRDRGRDER